MSLLDFMDQPDAQLGLALLNAGGPSTVPISFGQRIAGAVGQAQHGRDAMEDRKFRRLLMQSQIDENASQAQERQAKMRLAQQGAEFDRAFLLGDPTGGGGAAAPAPGGLMGNAPAGGGGVAPGAAPTAAPASGLPYGGMSARQISERYGIPLDQIIADHRFNGGKKIAEFIDSRTKADWTVVNGYRFNKNDPGSRTGYMPGISTSANGQTTVTDVDPRTGQPYAYAAPGSVEAAGAFVDAQERAKAPYAPGKGRIGASGRPEPTSVAEDLGIGRAPAPSAVLPGRPLGAPVPGRQFSSPGLAGGNTANAASGQVEVLSSELGKAGQELQRAQQAGDPAAVQRAQSDLAGIARELQRLPGGAQALAQLTQGGAAPARPAGVPVAAGAPLPGRPFGAPAAAPAQADGTGIGVAGGTDFSPMEKAAQEAERTRGIERAKAGVELETAPARAAAEAEKTRQVATARADVEGIPDRTKAITQASDAIAVVDKALNHPGLKSGTGLSSVADPRNLVPGTDAYNFRVVVDQLKGKAFLAAFESLKGGGAISVAEGEKASDALARLNRAQSTSEYEVALKEFKTILQRGMDNAKSMNEAARGRSNGGSPNAQEPPKQTAGKVFETLPNATQFKGRTLRDTSTGKKMISDGITWKAAD